MAARTKAPKTHRKRLRNETAAAREIGGVGKEPTIAEVMDSLPDISGPEFDAVFEEIERFRHDPVANTLRDVDL